MALNTTENPIGYTNIDLPLTESMEKNPIFTIGQTEGLITKPLGRDRIRKSVFERADFLAGASFAYSLAFLLPTWFSHSTDFSELSLVRSASTVATVSIAYLGSRGLVTALAGRNAVSRFWSMPMSKRLNTTKRGIVSMLKVPERKFIELSQ